MRKLLLSSIFLFQFSLFAFSCFETPFSDTPGKNTLGDHGGIQIPPDLVHKEYGTPFWGPNGWIIFGHCPQDSIGNDIIDSSGWYRIRPDGSDKKVMFLNNNVGVLISPRGISSDGKWIAAHGNGQIFKVSAEGNSIVQITIDPVLKFFPTWSPDGRWLAFTINDDLPFKKRGLYKTNCDGGIYGFWMNIDSTRPSAIMPSWSPKGTEIAFVLYRPNFGFKDLALFDTATQQVRILLQTDVGVHEPVFSPDGSKLLFYMVPETENPSIWVISRDGSSLRKLTFEGGMYPSWSPDGSKIVYVKFTYDWRVAGTDNGTLWVMNADGSHKYQLTF
jgi:Tol biopolymer transport system component